MRKVKEIEQKDDIPRGKPPPEVPIKIPGRPGPTPRGFRFRTLHEAERTLQRITNLILERERSVLEREAAAEALRNAKTEGCDPMELPQMPPLRGLSNEAAGRIINAVNGFVISRRFQDELAEKRRADDLETRSTKPSSSTSAMGSVSRNTGEEQILLARQPLEQSEQYVRCRAHQRLAVGPGRCCCLWPEPPSEMAA